MQKEQNSQDFAFCIGFIYGICFLLQNAKICLAANLVTDAQRREGVAMYISCRFCSTVFAKQKLRRFLPIVLWL